MTDSQSTEKMRDNALHAKSALILRCIECGKEFQPTREWNHFCSDACRWENWKQSHVRVNKAVMASVFGADWKARYDGEKKRRDE